VHGKSTRQLHGRIRAVNGRLDGRCAAAYGPCTRPCNVSCVCYTAAVSHEHVFARENGRYTLFLHGRITAVPYTRPVHGRVWAVHMTVYGPSARTSSAVCMALTRPVHGTCSVHGRVHDTYTAAYTCLRVYMYGRVTRPCYTAVYGPSARPKTAVYTAVNGRVTCRVYGRVRAVSAHVHGSVRAVYTAFFGRVHWPCTLPFSAVYIARTRRCNGPCTRPLHGRVQGLPGPCIRQVGLPGRVHVHRRHATAVCGLLRHTVCVRGGVHGPCRRTCTRLCMRRVHDRVYDALRPCTRPTAVTCSLGPCTRPCMPTCHVHDCVLAVYTEVYMARTRPFNCGVDVCTCRTAV